MNRKSVLIIDDNANISELMTEYLKAQPEFSSVEHTSTVESTITRSMQFKEPDAILMDIMLPGMNGIQGVKEVLKIWPNASVIMNSVLDDADAVYQSLEAGALGYVTKDMSLETIKNAINIVLSGGSFMNAKIARQVVAYFQRGQTVRGMLNDKEWAIANGIKDGLSYKMIADREELSIDGVRFYIQRIYRKLNINSRGELAKMMSWVLAFSGVYLMFAAPSHRGLGQ